MSKIKRTALSIAAALATVTASPAVNAGDFRLTDNLSVTGFIDMSYVYTDADGASSESSSGLDQFEIDLVYSFDDKLKAQVDIEFQDQDTSDADDELVADLEQAFFTYAVTDEFTFKAGRFLSYSGWETEEPTGLFQYSGTGYGGYFYGGYQQGISGLYSSGHFSAALSVVNDIGGEGRDSEKPAIEAMLALSPTESVTVKCFYIVDGDTKLINTWASYSAGDLTLAAEYNLGDYDDGSDGSGYLLMANYAMGSAGITVRYHDYEVESADGSTKDDGSAITISPSYAVSDNLLMVFEYRMDESDINGDSDSIAVEALVTF